MLEKILILLSALAAAVYLFRRFMTGRRGCSCCGSRPGACSGSPGSSGCELSLRRLEVGQKAVIVDILAEGELGRRIRDMGLIPGAEVQVLGRAPLKDPVALRLKGFTLSLRGNEADYILVRLI